MRLLKRFLAGLILVAGLVALLTRLATPLLSELRDDVAMLASETLGIPLSIGAIQARWHGIRPIIELRDVEYVAINGMLKTLDPHTVLLPPEVYEEMRTSTRGQFGGLGIEIDRKALSRWGKRFFVMDRRRLVWFSLRTRGLKASLEIDRARKGRMTASVAARPPASGLVEGDRTPPRSH